MDNSRTPWKFWLPLVGTLTVLLISYGPLLERFFRSLWARSHYQYFPFVLAAFAWLLWQRTREATPRENTKSRWKGLRDNLLLSIAWGLLGIAYFADSPWLAAVSAIVLVAGFLFRLSRDRKICNLWGIWILLWLIIPLPMNRDQQLIAMLQRGSSQLASTLLDWLKIPHLMSGNILLLSEKQLFVDEACSGIVSILSIVSCAVIYSVWHNLAPIRGVLLTLAGVGWATLMNVTRISTIAFAFDRWGLDWSEGWQHELLGLVLFSLTFLSLMSTDILLNWAMSPIAHAWADYYGKVPEYGRRLIAFWDGMLHWATPQPVGNRSLSRLSLGRIPPSEGKLDSFGRLGARSNINAKETPRELPSLSAQKRPPWIFGMVSLFAFGALGGIQYGYGDWLGNLENEQVLNSQNALVLKNASEIEEGVLPKKFEGFQRSTFKQEQRETGSIFGKYSRSYEYRDVQENMLLVSCDYPFGGEWHDLTICYQGSGWQTISNQTIPCDSSREGEKWDYVEVDFLGRDGTKGFLVYCQFDEYGRAAVPPASTYFSYVWQRLRRPAGSAQGKQFFQIQIWTTGVKNVSDQEKEAARDLLLESRERLRDYITKSN